MRILSALLLSATITLGGCSNIVVDSRWRAKAGGPGLLGEGAAWLLTNLDTSGCEKQVRKAEQRNRFDRSRKSLKRSRSDTVTYTEIWCESRLRPFAK